MECDWPFRFAYLAQERQRVPAIGHPAIRNRKGQEVDAARTAQGALALKAELRRFIRLEQADDEADPRAEPMVDLVLDPVARARSRGDRDALRKGVLDPVDVGCHAGS